MKATLSRRSFVASLCLVCFAAGAAAAADSIEPFNGKDLTGWKAKHPDKSHWAAGTAALNPQNPGELKLAAGTGELANTQGGGSDLYSEQSFGDGRYEVEVMVPKGSNSGIYLMGEYEIQVFDSFGKEPIGMGDMGAIYSAAVPKVNASKAAGEWQKFVIDFRAPKFDADGKKTANAKVVKATLNGQVIHEDVEIKGVTGGALTGKEAAKGPLLFQGDHGAVAYRNIKITPQ
jgi:hypothetical protein